jgi:hypothetical protein
MKSLVTIRCEKHGRRLIEVMVNPDTGEFVARGSGSKGTSMILFPRTLGGTEGIEHVHCPDNFDEDFLIVKTELSTYVEEALGSRPFPIWARPVAVDGKAAIMAWTHQQLPSDDPGPYLRRNL